MIESTKITKLKNIGLFAQNLSVIILLFICSVPKQSIARTLKFVIISRNSMFTLLIL